ncbi:MAG: DHHA1 domain-containing protein [Candidatus Aenigmatarchaeota archaeon]
MKWKEEMIKPAIDFIKKSKNDTAIILGHDCDSIASSSIIFKIFRKIGKKAKLIVSKFNFEVDEETVEKCKNFENIIIVDIGDTPEERINSLKNKKNILIIDHHPPKRYNCSYVNPRIFKKNAYIPTSYLSWLIYKKILKDDSEILWIAGFGTLGDFGAEKNKNLFRRIKKYEKTLVDNLKIKDRILIEKSLLGKITRMIDSCRIFGGIDGVKYIARLISQSKTYKDVLKDRRINYYFKKLKKEFKKEIKKIKKHALIINDYLLYELKTKYNLKSSLASFLPKIYKDKIILIAQKNKEGFFEISIRRGIERNDNLLKLVKEICKKISAKGGGHPTAAGMRIDKIEELIEFIKNKERKQ